MASSDIAPRVPITRQKSGFPVILFKLEVNLIKQERFQVKMAKAVFMLSIVPANIFLVFIRVSLLYFHKLFRFRHKPHFGF